MSIESAFRSLEFPPLSSGQHREDSTRNGKRGFAEGYAEGMRRAALELEQRSAEQVLENAERTARTEIRLQESLDALSAISTALRTRDEPIVRDWLSVIEQGALDLAEALIGAELRHDSASAAATLNRVFTQAEVALVLRVRMNPGDLAALDAERRDSLDLTLVADPTLQRGDAIAEYPDGEVDACLSRAIDRARQALRGEQR